MKSQATLSYGGDYNPEQWDPAVWREDIDLMVKAGVTMVTVGVFSWARMQPDAETWDTAWLHEVIDLLHAAGIRVDLATPTASPPPWLGALDPAVRAVTPEGHRFGHGSRNHFCPSSTTYRERAIEVATRLGEEFGGHPGVVLWHVGNEYGQYCFCETCTEAFRGWLRRKYGTLTALNDAWGTAFWSQHYSEWGQIHLPGVVPYLVNPTQSLDHRRFASDLLLDCYREQRDALRPLVGELPITTNFMGFFDLIDYRTWAAEVDVIADDHYGDPASPDQPFQTALVHDLMRSLKHAPWLMMEQAMGAVNWRQRNVPKTDAQRRADVLRSVAHGADGVLSFQWRQSRSGSERFHSAMLPNAGADTRYHRSVRQLGEELRAMADVAGEHRRGDIALLFDWESMWTLQEPSVPDRSRQVIETLQAWYRPLWERGFLVDVVSATEDLSPYRLVLAPSLHLLRAEARETLRAHVEAGRGLIMGAFSAAVDENDALLPGPFPVGFTDLLGASGEQWWPLPDDGVQLRSTRWGQMHVSGWAEQLALTDGEALASYDHSDLGPAIVRKGEFTYLTCLPPHEVLADLIAEAAEAQAIRPDLGPVRSAAGAEVLRRGPLTFIFNNTTHAITLDLLREASDALTGIPTGDALTLSAGESVVLREVQQ